MAQSSRHNPAVLTEPSLKYTQIVDCKNEIIHNCWHFISTINTTCESLKANILYLLAF